MLLFPRLCLGALDSFLALTSSSSSQGSRVFMMQCPGLPSLEPRTVARCLLCKGQMCLPSPVSTPYWAKVIFFLKWKSCRANPFLKKSPLNARKGSPQTLWSGHWQWIPTCISPHPYQQPLAFIELAQLQAPHSTMSYEPVKQALSLPHLSEEYPSGHLGWQWIIQTRE